MGQGNKDYSSSSLSLMRSKFDAYCYRPDSEEEFRNDLKRVKDAFPKARHVLYAYRIKAKDGSTKEGMSENGEPINAMHKILFKFTKEGIDDCAVIIVRYFGGKLLGAANLEHAFMDVFDDCYQKYRKGDYDGTK